MAKKRRHSSSHTGQPSSKRHLKEVIVIDDDDEEEPLEAILAKINAQEQSEALARQLQAGCAGSSSGGTASGSGTIAIDDETDVPMDGDEALARRLAAEWAAEESAAQPRASTSQSPVSSSSGPSSSSNARADVPVYNKCDNTTPDVKLRECQDLFIGTRPCSKCKHDIPSPRGYVTYTSESLPPFSLVNLLHATCSACKTVHCRGCFQITSCAPDCKGKDTPCKTLTCCPEIRAIALFEALGGFDRQYLGEQTTSATRSREAAAYYRQTQHASVGPGGTGYGTGTYHTGQHLTVGPSWEGFGAGSFYTSQATPLLNGGMRRRKRSGKQTTLPYSPAEGAAAHWDALLVRALGTVTALLPAPYAEDARVYDMLPHAATPHLLAASQLPELLAGLLRNDSVTDWTARAEVYHAMLVLLRRMGDCELTLEVLVNERFELASSDGLEEWMWGDGTIAWATASPASTTPPRTNALYSHFQKLTTQSAAFLAGAAALLEGADGETEHAVQAVSLCGAIIAARDDLQRAMRVLARRTTDAGTSKDIDTPGVPARKPTADALEKRYAAAHARLAFAHVAFPRGADGTYEGHAYAAELRASAGGTRAPAARLRLLKELAVMATSLPCGVWVRADEVRNDALKIMIVGPEGTPYAHGLFAFDCVLPLAYPASPPCLRLCTTGGGRVRFNPNLYACGKVCLSLLGTWPGRPEEQWSAARSTLLQVLVSVQSMILVELPYFNEPGYGKARADDPRSVAYNKNITAQTTRWAIVDWLSDAHATGIWADVIKAHFTLREDAIRESIAGWARAEPAIRRYTSSGGGKGSTDLLAEFERGMARVKGWAD